MSATGKKLSGAFVAARMKKLARFTDLQLAEELQINETNARRWRADFAGQGLLKIDGLGEKPRKGRTPYAWRWQG